jgi:hypothetical protein
MGEILGIGLTHYPGFNGRDEKMTAALKRTLADPGLPDKYKRQENWPAEMREEWDDVANEASKHRELCVGNFRRLRDELDEFDPDFVLVWGDDQYENFQDTIIPPYCILAYDQVDITPWASKQTYVGGQMKRFGFGGNYWNEPEDKVFHLEGHKEGGKYLAGSLLAQGFDVSYAYRPLHHEGLPHPFTNTLLFLDYDRKGFDYPMVPFQVNCYGRKVVSQRAQFPDLTKPIPEEELDPPSPMPWRCFDMGRSIARAILESPYRVALVASSSWSHAFLSPATNYILPNIQSDRKLYNALVNGDYDYWRNFPLEEIENNGQLEILNWECLLGAMKEAGYSKPRYADKVETYVFNSTKVFAVY